jgi:tetratricopeptide (TPR) repeat protein
MDTINEPQNANSNRTIDNIIPYNEIALIETIPVNEIKKKLIQHHKIGLYGPRRIGKTCNAVRLAYMLKGEGMTVLWFDVSNNDTFLRDVRVFYDSMKTTSLKEEPYQLVFDSIKSILGSDFDKKYLLVLDGIESISIEINNLLTDLPDNVYLVVISSNNAIFVDLVEEEAKFEIKEFNEEQAKKLFSACKRKFNEQETQILNKYLSSGKVNPDELNLLVELLNKYEDVLVKDIFVKGAQLDEQVSNIFLKKISEKSLAANYLMRCCSLMHHSFVSCSFIQALLVIDKKEALKAIHVLKENGVAKLIKQISASKDISIEINPKIKESMKKACRKENKLDELCIRLSSTYQTIAVDLRENNDNANSLFYFISIISLFEENFYVFTNHRKDLFGACYGNVGVIYSEFGEFKKCLYYLIKAIRIKEKILPDLKSITFTKLYGTLGIAYMNLKDYDNAIEWLNKAIEVFEIKLNDKSSLNLSKYYGYLGDMYIEIGKSEKSIACFKKSIELIKESIAPVQYENTELGEILNEYESLKTRDITQKDNN